MHEICYSVHDVPGSARKRSSTLATGRLSRGVGALKCSGQQMVTYDSNLKPTDVEQLHALLKDTYWANTRTIAAVKDSIQNSIIIFARNEKGEVIGSARAVTDEATFSWICDVVVATSSRGRGIGKQLVTRLLEDDRIKYTRKVLVTRDAQSLYSQFGFRPHPYECMICYEDAAQQGGEPDATPRRQVP